MAKAVTAKVAKAATAKVATAKAATAKAKAATAKAKAATAKVATSKTAAAPRTDATRPAATKSTPATSTATKRTTAGSTSAGPAAGKPAAGKPAAARAAAGKAVAGPSEASKPAHESTARKAAAAEVTKKKAPRSAAVEASVVTSQRPMPYKRPVLADLVESAEAQAREVVAESVPAAVLGEQDGRTGRSLRRRLPLSRLRPVLYLAAALIGALGVSLTTGEPQPAQAETATVSHSVSVAEELGIEIEAQPIEEITPQAATARLGELATSRTERDQAQERAALIQARADRAALEAAAAAAAEAARPDAVLPVQGARLTSGFGARWGTLHAGIDLAAPMMTPEYAVMDGIVLEAGPASGYGNAVYIQHENGDVTVYGHMEQILVSAGQVVKAGETIALLGNRGQSTGPHLHFEVHVGGLDGTKVDPIPWLRERGIDI